ncbi:MAG: methionine--tRNA ligase [Chloroflexi bacterium]|nr:methionine--tRNA ligase [Chloroflexota bacterium]
MESFYLTTPIYYANDLPHIGHAYTTIAADSIARYQRQQGREVFLLTGTDEHGVNIERIAARNGGSATDHVDRIANSFKQLWQQLDIGYDRFIRTTEPAHHRAALALWQRLQDSDDLYRGTYTGAYCAKCEAYYQPDELVDGACPVHASPCDVVSEENWFFRLSHYQDALERLVRDTPFVQPESRRNEVLAVIRQGLRDFSVSRRNVRWGVPVPDSSDEVIYVWVDALANYLTGVGYPGDGACFERWWPAQLHLVGKEIIRFHCLYWPALLLSAGLPLPKQVFAHGWLTKDGQKISKSTGNTINPFALVDEFGSDAVRYYLLRNVAFGQDGDFTRRGFVDRYNAELANGFGNLVQRVTSLASRYGVCRSETDGALSDAAASAHSRQARAFGDLALHEAVAAADDFVRDVNRYLQVASPWDLARNGQVQQVQAVLAEAVKGARVAAELYAPIIPGAAAEASRRLADGPEVGEPLFPRVRVDNSLLV